MQVLDHLKQLDVQQYVPPVDIAVVYAGLGDGHRALQRLEQACAERYPLFLYFLVTHAFDGLRSNPRFGMLIKKLGW